MATPPEDLDKCRQRRAAAKGNITKISNRIRIMSEGPNADLDMETIERQKESLGKAAVNFTANHSALMEGEEDADMDRFSDEFGSHASLVEDIRCMMQHVLNRATAFESAANMEEALEAMERGRDRPYCSGHDVELASVTRKVEAFRETRNLKGARTNEELRTIRDQALLRLERLNQEHDASKLTSVAPVAVALPVREPSSPVSRVKIPPPVFDGTIMGWKHFWELFSALLARTPTMADIDKRCLLVEAMGTADAKTAGMKATANSTSFEEMVKTLQDVYDKNRVVHGYHYGEMVRHDSFSDAYDDVNRMWDRIRDCKRGFTLSKGYSADQFITAHFERLMKPALLRRWMDFTPTHQSTPPVDVLLEFLERQRTATATASTIPRDHIGGAVAGSFYHKPRPAAVTPPTAARAQTKPMHNIKTVTVRPGTKCYYCSAEHTVFNCEDFAAMEVSQRWEWARTGSRCSNCFSNRHLVDACPSSYRCKVCKEPHHSLLHSPVGEDGGSAEDGSHTMGPVSKLSSGQPAYPLPRTAIVSIRSTALLQKARAQLDSGASVSLITTALSRTLHAKPLPHSKATMVGVGGVTYTSLHTVRAILIGNKGEELDTLFHVVDTICATESRTDMRRIRRLPFVKTLDLSDPLYTPTSRIDLLLDMGSTNACFKNDAKFSESGLLRAQNSIFGWTVGGHDSSDEAPLGVIPVCLRVSTESGVDDTPLLPLLLRFWELDETSSDVDPLSSEDQYAVTFCKEQLIRDEDGRYRVSLPRHQPVMELGRSRSAAMVRYLRNESSLKKRGMWDAFCLALREYGELNHAERVPDKDLRNAHASSFYLPMHGVFKETSTTTKLRLVFDASARSTNGVSLNDTLLPGPSLYPLLTSVLTGFRSHPIGMTSDISKMFREIGLNPCEQDHHRFLQRGSDGEMQDWRMTRLTFGVSPSPFLATLVLRQLADDYASEYPGAAQTIKSSFYVDDCLTGAEELTQAIQLREELNLLCDKAKMTLRKWRSNSSELMDTIPEERRETTDLRIVSTPGEHAKTLGLHWDTTRDCFYVATPAINESTPATRRIIASSIARTFDVMGWFSPALLPAKLLLKKTWILRLGWDEKLDESLQTLWKKWATGLNCITACPVPRFMGIVGRRIVRVQYHGFSDASLLAYGGVVYRRVLYSDGSVSVHLVTSKSRVTPLKGSEKNDQAAGLVDTASSPSKKPVAKDPTVPRLELCGAVVLARLLHSVSLDLPDPEPELFAWCDSSSVLGWISKDPSLLSVYVANRVVKITALVPSELWRYVSTSDNPADCLSRGLDPRDLEKASLWWKGPAWLVQDQDEWPRRPDINMNRELGEVRGTVMRVTLVSEELGLRMSSYDRLLRAMCYVRRFTNHSKRNQYGERLTLEELKDADTHLIRCSQLHFYPEVIASLRKGNPLHKRQPLASLAPYLDDVGVLRVGGRLQNAELSSACTHPVILHAQSHLVLLMVRRSHQKLMHAGPSTMMSTLAAHFHIPKLRPVVRKVTRSCVICQKASAHTSTQLMGQLPALRTQPSFPFNTVGIDFAGPVLIKRGNPRRPTLVKSYLCVFIDFTCRATHLEVVSDMTTPAFLAALSRFVGRRGTPSTIFSDNGSNFVGADAELKRMLEILSSDAAKQSVESWASQNGVDWQFSPARAPHFGGLWESTVKLAKALIKKSVGERRLNFEELSTFAISAEAVINSRPLTPLHATSDDAIAALTPGHFLIGRPLKALPSLPDLSPVLSHIRRWNLVTRLVHDFWLRWRPEYLLLLQKRNKWLHPKRNLQKGDVVLIKDRDAFQRNWPMGRIAAVYPGPDGLVRVVDIWSQGKMMRRPIAKLVHLLKDDSTESSSGGGCLRQMGEGGGAEPDDCDAHD